MTVPKPNIPPLIKGGGIKIIVSGPTQVRCSDPRVVVERIVS